MIFLTIYYALYAKIGICLMSRKS